MIIVPWKITDNADIQAGTIIHLIPLSEWNKIPNGTIVYSIFGERKVKGKDEIDLDTRAGMLAYGIIPK